MIYLNAEVVSGLGEDTFWTWFKREFPSSSFDVPKSLNNDDILLRYSTLGFYPISGKQVSLCWELYPQMKRLFGSNQWDSKITKVYESAKYSTYRTVATMHSVSSYSEFGTVEVIPIGVNTELFCPILDKDVLRRKYNLPDNKEIGFWAGTTHPMKGFIELLQYASFNPDIHWIIVWKWQQEAGLLENASNFVNVSQTQLSELMNASDFFLATSKLSPFYMIEWEAMSCNLPMKFVGGTEREFNPYPNNPRDNVFEMGWSRNQVKMIWDSFMTKRGVKW